jgi:hypothetical protein
MDDTPRLFESITVEHDPVELDSEDELLLDENLE